MREKHVKHEAVRTVRIFKNICVDNKEKSVTVNSDRYIAMLDPLSCDIQEDLS